MRYEYDRAKVDVTEGASFFNFDKINPVCNCPGVIEFGINKYKLTRKHTPLYYQPPFNFAPRFGFALTPFAKQDLVIRGGYGWFYIGGDYGDIFWDGPVLGRGTIQDWTSDAQGLTPAFKFSEGFPAVPIEPLSDGWGAVPIGQSPRTNPKFFWYNRTAGYAQRFNLGVQKQFGRNLLEVGYLGNAVKDIPNHAGGLNEVPPQLLAPGNAQLRRPFPQFGTVTGYGMNRASSLYHAGLISFRRQFSGGLTLQTSYTFARHLDNLGSRSYYNLKADYGPSSLQRRHRFVWSSVYELPFGTGKPLLGSGLAAKIFGGWTVGNFIEIVSGAPFTVSSIVNTCNCFSQGNQGVDRLGSAARISGGFDPIKDTWFNTAAFGFAQLYRFGNSGKGIIEGPGLATVNTTISKIFSLTERFKLETRGELFNMFDRVNFNNPSGSLGSASFGRVTSASDPRRIQLGAKFHF